MEKKNDATRTKAFVRLRCAPWGDPRRRRLSGRINSSYIRYFLLWSFFVLYSSPSVSSFDNKIHIQLKSVTLKIEFRTSKSSSEQELTNLKFGINPQPSIDPPVRCKTEAETWSCIWNKLWKLCLMFIEMSPGTCVTSSAQDLCRGSYSLWLSPQAPMVSDSLF